MTPVRSNMLNVPRSINLPLQQMQRTQLTQVTQRPQRKDRSGVYILALVTMHWMEIQLKHAGRSSRHDIHITPNRSVAR